MDKYSLIKYWIIDVDGTMTDGGVYYDENGNEIKKFNTRDAAGFFAVQACGMKIIVLTGRKCSATEQRMKELNVDYLFQNVKNKKDFLVTFFAEHKIEKSEVAYIGDDVNDFAPMQLAGFIGCPADACGEVKMIADYISNIQGGQGAVRDVISHVLKKSNMWDKAIAHVYNI